MKVAILGGSGAATPELIEALVDWPGGPERRPALEIVLHGRSLDKLRLVAAACRARLPEGGPALTVAETGDLGAAIDGAEAIVVQVRVGGLAARRFDESFPRAHGLPGEETMGPGGFANALRTVPTLAPIWSAIEERAPDAIVLNVTNPAGMVTAAARRQTSLRIVSVCETPTTLTDAVAVRLRRSPGAVRPGYVGLNHVGFWTPDDPSDLSDLQTVAPGIEAEDLERFRALPQPYVRYYLRPEWLLEAQRSSAETRAETLLRLEGEMLGQYERGEAPRSASRRGAAWYAKGIVPLLDAIVHGSQAPLIIGLPNQGLLPSLPTDVTVESPTEVTAGGGFTRLPPRPVPGPAASLLAAHAEYERLTVEALDGLIDPRDVAGRRSDLVQALTANPMVRAEKAAAALVDAILADSPEMGSLTT